ncbi:MAG: ATP-grasp domain-containing protein [Candidatus Magnetobacterium sp. LHC-1]|uniref:ATP-grasp domain-containing protein n=1 Tax=Candidatus Magnetobacterium casense TaxID=1455061 RepID=A0ABS6RVE2_9BACT|nr:ATP-grasp domain-containing protein [Candidatus Magnetobacterium casensis]MBV6340315.1 ATP-grasp domain-containing protein [Candidatus Magnetobacterium casensis]
MDIGFTYDLRSEYLALGYGEEETAEFDSVQTIESLEEAITQLGHSVTRVGNIRSLVGMLNGGRRWNLVFNICEGLHGRSREAQIPALLEAYDIACCFSDPLTMALSLDKGLTKTVVRAAGVATPNHVVIDSVEALDSPGVLTGLGYPLFVKPLHEGTGKGVNEGSVVHNEQGLRQRCSWLLERYRQPALVEGYLCGREFTVGILGSGSDAYVIGVLEVVIRQRQSGYVYSYENKEFCEQLVDYVLVEDARIKQEASALAIAAYRAIGCRDAGRVDVKADAAGRLCFLEINPLPGLHPTHSDLPILCTKAGMSYVQLIGEIIASASVRVKGAKL